MPAEVQPSVIKCVIVGDGAVGKTCLLISYAKGEFPVNYVPTVFDNYAVQLPVGDKTVTLNLFDTAGQEDYERLRPMSYVNASVFLVCFSLASRSSFENVEDKWVPELRKYAKGMPYILVGTQSDKPGRAVTQKDGAELAKRIGAAQYCECSAKSRDGLRDVFVEAIMTVINGGGSSAGKDDKAKASYRKKKGCTIG